MNTKDLISKKKKEVRLELDELIEDMESYIELPDNKSYQDELFDRLNKWQKSFLHSFALELIETVSEEIIGKDETRNTLKEKIIGILFAKSGVMTIEEVADLILNELDQIINSIILLKEHDQN
jgi:hypothetical protein